MAQLNIPTIAPVLNQMVADLQTQFENQTTFYNSVVKRKNEGFVNGKGWRIPSDMQRPTGITAGTEGFSFNQPGLPAFADMYVYPAQVALAFELSGRTIRNFNAGSKESQISDFSQYMAKVAAALTKDLERNSFGDGSGLRATATSSSGGTLTCASTAASAYGSTKGTVWLEIGQLYDVLSSAGALRGQALVTAKPSATTATVTYSGMVDADVTAGDILVPAGGYLNFPRGLAYIVNNDTGTFQLQSRSTYPQLRPCRTGRRRQPIALHVREVDAAALEEHPLFGEPADAFAAQCSGGGGAGVASPGQLLQRALVELPERGGDAFLQIEQIAAHDGYVHGRCPGAVPGWL